MYVVMFTLTKRAVLVATALTSLTVNCPKWKRKTKKEYIDIAYIVLYVPNGNQFIYVVTFYLFYFSQLRDSFIRRA